MTNIKPIAPFCVNMSEATEEEVRELHQMCLDAGAKNIESENDFVYEIRTYPYKGIDDGNTTLSHNDYHLHHFNHNVLTLDQVTQHLDLPTTNEEQDKSLVEGTIEHLYTTFGDDLSCLHDNTYSVNEPVIWYYGEDEGEVYTICGHNGPSYGKFINVCTVKGFQEYCLQQSKVSPHTSVDAPLIGFNTTHVADFPECVKHAVWTPECVKQCISFNVDTQVSVDNANVKGDCILVTAIGKEFVLLDVDGKEHCVRKEEVLPYEEVVLSQRDKVMAYLEQGFDEEDSSKIYNEILKLGVFKEDGDYESM